jgi:integrase
MKEEGKGMKVFDTTAVRERPRAEIELGPDAEPMDLFYLVMRNNTLPLSTRMRAAERIADFKYPKKQAIAVMPAAGDLGTVLEAARKRAPKTLEDLTPEEYEAVMSARAKAETPVLAQPSTRTDLSAKPMVSDRRFRK